MPQASAIHTTMFSSTTFAQHLLTMLFKFEILGEIGLIPASNTHSSVVFLRILVATFESVDEILNYDYQ